MRFCVKVGYILTLATALTGVASSPISASVISFNFSGIVDPRAQAGDQFSGTFAFDPSEATTIPSDNPPFTATYDLGPSSVLTLQVDDQPERIDRGDVQMRVAEFPADKGFSADSTIVEIWGPGDQNGVSSFLSLGNLGLLYSSLLPPTSFSLADFSNAEILVGNRINGGPFWTGNLDSLGMNDPSLPPPEWVPEPPCTTLIFIAAAGLVGLKHTRDRRSRTSP